MIVVIRHINQKLIVYITCFKIKSYITMHLISTNQQNTYTSFVNYI